MRRPLLATLTIAVASAAIVAGVAGCGSGAGTSSTTATSASGGNANGGGGGGGGQSGTQSGGGPGAPQNARTKNPGSRHRNQGPPGTTMQHTYAARILGQAQSQGGPIQPAELWPVRNSWRVSDHRTFTAVYAGANPDHHDTGRLVIFRQDFIHVRQTARDVDVQNSGPLEITSAPTGPSVGSSAQQNGDFQFRGTKGVTGTLHLSNDMVSVNRG